MGDILQSVLSVLRDITGAQVLSGIFGALFAAVLGHFLRVNREGRAAQKVRARQLRALEAEINYCARLAGTYIEQGYMAPLYRFPTTVYATVYPKLVSEILSDKDVAALTDFYSQAEQMNRGLDAMEGYRAASDELNMRDEHARLLHKAQQMRHRTESLSGPSDSEFYVNVIASLQRHVPKKWTERFAARLRANSVHRLTQTDTSARIPPPATERSPGDKSGT